jgi:voltage-gated potassium channel
MPDVPDGLDVLDVIDGDRYLTERLLRWRRWTDLPLVALAVGSMPLLLLELKRQELNSADQRFLTIVNIVICAAFAIDYVVEFWLAGNKAMFAKKEWTSLVIVAAQLISLASTISAFGAFRVLRAGRVIRLVVVVVRSVAIGGATFRNSKTAFRKHAAGFALGVAALTWITSAVAFTLVEDVGSKRRISSFGDALWWSTATITTVGYGDIFPVTAVGRVVGAFTMFIGISTFAVVTAKVAEFLVRPQRETAALVDLPSNDSPVVEG